MAIFSRRRIQQMLDELDSYLDLSKRRDLTSRLNSKDADQSLPAEMELALLWMIKDFPGFEIEPSWWPGNKRPEAFIRELSKDRPAVVEVAAILDRTISGENIMHHCAQALAKIANSVEKGSGDCLFFQFAETPGTYRGRSTREIAATRDYAPSDSIRSNLTEWIKSGRSTTEKLRIDDGPVSVLIERHKRRFSPYNSFHCSRPPRTYSDTDNPIYRRLAEKVSQIEQAPDGTHRVIFLAECGSDTLSDLAERHSTIGVENHATAKTIINKFIENKRGRVDAVVVFVPYRRYYAPILEPHGHHSQWRVIVFGEDNIANQSLLDALQSIIEKLPAPRLTGRNARSVLRSRFLGLESRVSYLGTSMSGDIMKTSYKFSSRLLLDFLSGKMTEEQFRGYLGERSGEPKMFSEQLLQGKTISDIRIERGGMDEDDDSIVIDFDYDAAASPFK